VELIFHSHTVNYMAASNARRAVPRQWWQLKRVHDKQILIRLLTSENTLQRWVKRVVEDGIQVERILFNDPKNT